jgi:hypothetical protein
MLLHGTGTPLPIGSLITSADSRKQKTSYFNSFADHVYFVDTEYTPAHPENDFVPRMEELELPQDEQTSTETKAYASAIYYGLNTATRRVHPLSQSLATSVIDIYGDARGEAYEKAASSMTEEDVYRLRKNLSDLGRSTEGYATSAEWEAMSSEEQEAFNEKYSVEEETPPNPLRGYWVYEVEVVKGTVEKDQHGHHESNYRVKNGQLRIKRAVIADGAVLSDEIPYPPTNAIIPEPNGQEQALLDEIGKRIKQKKAEAANSLHRKVVPSTFDLISCGAKTQEGSLCKRTVKGESCWQHKLKPVVK